MNEKNKRIIYNGDSFTIIIDEINSHIETIKKCFNEEFTLESYKGSQKDNIELAIRNILKTLEFFMNSLDNITEKLLDYKVMYEEAIMNIHEAVNGGDTNV